jgi:hypothetical protein
VDTPVQTLSKVDGKVCPAGLRKLVVETDLPSWSRNCGYIAAQRVIPVGIIGKLGCADVTLVAWVADEPPARHQELYDGRRLGR